MSNQTNINGASPDQDEGPDMTPQERRLWAASHKLPRRYVLVTADEMKVMGASMAEQRALTGALQRTFRACEMTLGEYWRTEPDLPNGVAAAVFDAGRWKKAAIRVVQDLRRLKAEVEGKIASEPRETAEALASIARAVEGCIAEIDKASNLRRDRRPKS